jgi:hypothetical protein
MNKGRIYMNGLQVDNTEKFTSIDEIIQFYTQSQAQDLQHTDIVTKELEQENGRR